MIIEGWLGGTINIDLRTDTSKGGGATSHNVDHQTEVSYGNLHARVTFKELGIAVTMDTYSGNWKDAAWAREQAFEALRKALTLKDLITLVVVLKGAGRDEGREAAKADIREVLGL